MTAVSVTEGRDDRYYRSPRKLDPADPRPASARDRDRIQYTSAFRRLAGITQVVSPTEGHVFHNRLTHTLEVAQIGRRLAQKVAADQPELAAAFGVDPEVVEAAALAHDLGHPPFGHATEKVLQEILEEMKFSESFEGNAQSFRIVTKLAVHRQNPGLNLTRATLNALLKYPCLREDALDPEHPKWGAYDSERSEFEWARKPYGADRNKSAEAELMDWADDVAYSVHDIEDFYRAGFIPLDQLSGQDSRERDRFLAGTFARREREGIDANSSPTWDELTDAFVALVTLFPFSSPYRGTRADRALLREQTAFLINDYVSAIMLTSPATNRGRRVRIDDRVRREVIMCKELTWYYVINRPTLVMQRRGGEQVIRELFAALMDAAESRLGYVMFPEGHQERLSNAATTPDRIRIVVDFIASMTEPQAIQTHQRLTGASLGSLWEPVAT